MYTKLGWIYQASEVFESLQKQDLVSWNALMAAFSQMGNIEKVSICFHQLSIEGLEPDTVTFSIILNAYSHAGLQNEGLIFFYTIINNYSFSPSLEHYTCMVDLFGRAGHFENAVAVVKKAPTSDYLPIWTSLLGACQKWGNVELGRFAFNQLVQTQQSCSFSLCA